MSKYVKRYGIFILSDDGLKGLVERSFSMDYKSDAVRVYERKHAEHMLAKVKEWHPDWNSVMVKITSNYPKALEKLTGKKVRIHWKERQADIDSPEYTTKYNWRNVPFSIEGNKE